MYLSDMISVARRFRTEECSYYPADEFGLMTNFSINASDDICSSVNVRITNTLNEDFNGVVHIKLMIEEKEPKFFMPGFMYNTNTADKPSSGRKAFPRIKRNPAGMPESDFFMTRSDRLAEPISLVYGSGKVRGISAPPYWVRENGKTVPVTFDKGVKNKPGAEFFRYGGFSCNINDDGQ